MSLSLICHLEPEMYSSAWDSLSTSMVSYTYNDRRGRAKYVIGAVIVSTPQDVALVDARKGVGMFHKVSIPVRSWPSLSYSAKGDISDNRIIIEYVTLHLHILFDPT
jgi:hypothetical protein